MGRVGSRLGGGIRAIKLIGCVSRVVYRTCWSDGLARHVNRVWCVDRTS